MAADQQVRVVRSPVPKRGTEKGKEVELFVKHMYIYIYIYNQFVFLVGVHQLEHEIGVVGGTHVLPLADFSLDICMVDVEMGVQRFKT